MQKSILKFQQSNGNDGIIKISQGENIGTHQHTLNNDYNGTDQGQDYLLAPFTGIVKALRASDNQIYFESVGCVQTPKGVYEKVGITCTHMNEEDRITLGVKVGAKFEQGQRLYREGTKGLGSGNHIHMSQGVGKFKGTPTMPTHKTSLVYVYNGKKYTQYKINAEKEVSAYDFFFVDSPVQKGLSDTANQYQWIQYSKSIEEETMHSEKMDQLVQYKLIKGSLQTGGYPTRDTFDGTWQSRYRIIEGALVDVDEIRIHKNELVMKIATGSLKGRWFVYDETNFQKER